MTIIARLSFIFIAAALCAAQSPSWTGVIDPSRAIDWSQAGAAGTSGSVAMLGALPSASWTQSGSTIAACGTAGTPVSSTACGIQAALTAAGANQYVLLGAGRFDLNTGIVFPAGKSNLVLRGSGADKTFLVFHGSDSCTGLGAAICVANASNPGMPTPAATTTWTAGYSAGTTVITVGSSSGMAVGNVLILDQLDSASDPGLTANYICSSSASTCTNAGQGGAGNNKRTNRSQQQLVRVTQIVGNNITITPPILASNWASGNSPGVSWYNGNMANDGVESLSVDCSLCGFSAGVGFNIGFIYAHDVWAYGVRSLYSQRANISFYQVLNGTASHNYLAGTLSGSSESYGVELYSTTNTLVINNICQGPVGCVSFNAPDTGSVVLYNYAPESRVDPGGTQNPVNGIPSYIFHDFCMLGLVEGNNGLGVEADDIHATHTLMTSFRNLLTGDVSGFKTGNLMPVRLFALAGRFQNIIGNVLGNNNGYYTGYWTNNAYGPNSIYNTGEGGDSNVASSLNRWGNYDTVTAAARFCVDATAPCSGSEVPSGLSFQAQPIPASHTLPTSFMNGVKLNLPSTATTTGGTGLLWWKVCKNWPTCSSTAIPAYPSVGPDVTGGAVNGYNGFANYNPATIAWQNMTVDSNYTTGNQAQITISSISVSGHTATVTFTGAAPNSFNSSGSYTANISGSSVTGYNRNWQINTPSPTNNPTSVTLTDPQLQGLAACSSNCGTITPTPILAFNSGIFLTDPSGPSISPTSLGPWTVGQAINLSPALTANGFSGTVTWSNPTNCGAACGAMPTGITSGAGSCSIGTTTGPTCTMSGTLTTTTGSPFAFTIRATDGITTVNQPYSVVVNARPVITTASGALLAGQALVPYSLPLATTGGTGGLTCSTSIGSLPPGLSWSGCALTGTPTTAGPYSFSALVTDANGVAAVSAVAFTLSIAAADTSTPRLLHATPCGSVTMPTTPCSITPALSGSLLALVFATGSAPTITGITDDQNNAWAACGSARGVNGTGSMSDVWYALGVAAGTSTITVTPNPPTQAIAVIYEIANANQCSQGAGLSNQTATGSPTGPAVTAPAKAFLVSAVDAGAKANAVAGPWTLDALLSFNAGFAHLVTTTAGPFAPIWTLNSSVTWEGSTASFTEGGPTPTSVFPPTGLSAIPGAVFH